MVNLIPQCVKCGSPVSDLVEPEVEKQGQLKSGHYINNNGYVMIVYNQTKLKMEI